MENDNDKELEGVDYIKMIDDLKKNTVSKEQYAKLVQENKQLAETLMQGGSLEQDEQETKRSIEDIRKDLFGKEHTNLEFVEKSLELRERIIEEGGKDPFLPYGEKIVPTNEDIECADRVSKVFKECIEYAEGDSDIFTNELMRRTIDTAPKINRK